MAERPPEPHSPRHRLVAGSYPAPTRSAGPAKRSTRRSVRPGQHGALGGGGTNRRSGMAAGRVRR
jgi:hypothetical protein